MYYGERETLVNFNYNDQKKRKKSREKGRKQLFALLLARILDTTVNDPQ